MLSSEAGNRGRGTAAMVFRRPWLCLLIIALLALPIALALAFVRDKCGQEPEKLPGATLVLKLNVTTLPEGMTPAQFRQAASEAAKGWTEDPLSAVTITIGEETTLEACHLDNDGTCTATGEDVIQFVDCDLTEEGGGERNAVTFVRCDPGTGHITGVSICLRLGPLNGHSWNTDRNPPGRGWVDLHSLLLHEMGHGLGLDHSDKRDVVMDPNLADGELRRNVLPDDLEGARSIYPDCDRDGTPDPP